MESFSRFDQPGNPGASAQSVGAGGATSRRSSTVRGLIATRAIVHSQPLPLPSMQALPRLLSQTLPRQLLTGVK